MANSHGIRKHSKFSASGASRWHACPGSVALSEGVIQKDSIYSIEGTKAHEVLEAIVTGSAIPEGATSEMVLHAKHTSAFIKEIYKKSCNAEFMVEQKVNLDFIHPEAFGTLDYSIVEHFGTLHILDYKFGQTFVSPVENLQFIFYALAVAYKFDWNFSKVKMWTLQPRIRNFDGFSFWEISIKELMDWIPKFKNAIKRISETPHEYVEGNHCHWCPGKLKCPLKNEGKMKKAMSVFQSNPIER